MVINIGVLGIDNKQSNMHLGITDWVHSDNNTDTQKQKPETKTESSFQMFSIIT